MAQLSRLKKNQELREKIDLETVITDPSVMPGANSMENTSTHEKKNYHPYKQYQATPNQSSITSSPVINDLLAEVKQYNVDNGDRVSPDTQINILKSLEEEEEPTLRRNKHILPMEEEEEKLGSTMKLPRTSLEALQHTSDILRYGRISKSNRISPLAEDESKEETLEHKDIFDKLRDDTPHEFSSVVVKPERIEFTEPMIIESAMEPIQPEQEEEPENNESEYDNSSEMEEDHLEIFEFVLDHSNDIEVVSENEIRIKPKKQETVKEEVPAPSKKSKKAKKKSRIGLIALVVILLALVAVAGYIAYTMFF